MKIKDGFVLRDVCGEKVIMGEGVGALDFGRLLCLNETAAFLWEIALTGEFSIESLAKKLCQEYDVTFESAMSDVTAIVAQWQEVKVLE